MEQGSSFTMKAAAGGNSDADVSEFSAAAAFYGELNPNE